MGTLKFTCPLFYIFSCEFLFAIFCVLFGKKRLKELTFNRFLLKHLHFSQIKNIFHKIKLQCFLRFWRVTITVTKL